MHPYKRASTTSDLTIRALRGSRLAFGRSYSSRLYRLDPIHPARIRRSISSDRFGVSVTVPPKKVKEVVWRHYCCPVALKTIFVAGARGIGTHTVSALLSEMVRPNVPKTSTKTAIIRPSPRGDRDTMHASSAYSITQIARRTHSSAVSGPTFDGYSCRWIRSTSMPASLLNLSSTTRSIAAKNTLNSSGESTHSCRSPCATSNHSEHRPSSLHTHDLISSWN